MKVLRFIVYAFVVIFFSAKVYAQSNNQTPAIKPSITIVTDNSWDVSNKQTKFGEYPLSAEKIATATTPLYGGPAKAVIADFGPRSKIIPGSKPIWRNQTSIPETDAYQFRKTVPLGAEPIVKATLEINCDDVARLYINQRLVSVEKRDGTIKDGYDDWYTFRSVTGFTSGRIYTYDVKDYFFTNFTNTILVEAVSLAFDGSHAYVSAKIVLEFGPLPVASKPSPAKPKPAAEPKPKAQTPPPAKPALPENTVFEAGSDPGIEKLRVGSILELGHVSFKADDYKLDSASYGTLDALAAYLKRYPGLKIEVGGHTNLRPSDRFAAELSTNRARTVAKYLTDKGVAAQQVTYKGYGKTQPRVNAVTKEADKANQRVEVKVLGK
ncbi:MAG: OmpA family protein [Saprospiraceae bacterium]|nr:OmpA family protein [Saprospiraceae bacterium]